MPFVASLNRFVQIIMDVLRQLFRWRIWVILATYYALQWLVLLANHQVASPVFGWVSSIILNFQSPQKAAAFAHYPAHFILLPGVFGWARFALGVVLEGLVLGAVAAKFLAIFSPKKDSAPRPVMGMWLQLAIVWIVINGLALVIGQVVPSLLESKLYSPKRVAVFVFFIMPLIFSVMSALFFYALAIAVATGTNAFSALKGAVGLCFRNPMTTFGLTILVIAGPIILSAITGAYATTIVDKFRPELVYNLLVVGIVVDMISAFLWMGVSSRLVAAELE